MSSSASERPPRDKTSRPFATLDHEKGRRTDPIRVSEQPRTPERPRAPEQPRVSEQPRTPEQLRKPYASLPPAAKRDDAMNSLGAGQSPAPAPRTPVPTGSTTEANPRYRPNAAQCRKHQIQRNRAGECLLCAKEAAAAQGTKGRALLWAGVIAVLLAAGAVVFLQAL